MSSASNTILKRRKHVSTQGIKQELSPKVTFFLPGLTFDRKDVVLFLVLFDGLDANSSPLDCRGLPVFNILEETLGLKHHVEWDSFSNVHGDGGQEGEKCQYRRQALSPRSFGMERPSHFSKSVTKNRKKKRKKVVGKKRKISWNFQLTTSSLLLSLLCLF